MTSSSSLATGGLSPAASAPHSTSHKPASPTHFLSIRISNPSIHSLLESQFYAPATNWRDGRISKHLCPLTKFHITLFVFRKSNDGEHEPGLAIQCLKSCEALVARHFRMGPPVLSLSGLECFDGGKVIYAGLQETEDVKKLRDFRNEAYEIFKRAECLVTQDKELWTPHATLAKVRGKSAKQLKEFWSEATASTKQRQWGSHTCDKVELSCMHKTGDDGYYLPLSSLSLTPAPIVSNTIYSVCI
ncbi:hypothetical protein SeLEV6574_g05479 [Synchytrium endobioticum]|nr:hypothetical protein SeLEV6574_g05479 [Synchytrium endobioticum]